MQPQRHIDQVWVIDIEILPLKVRSTHVIGIVIPVHEPDLLLDGCPEYHSNGETNLASLSTQEKVYDLVIDIQPQTSGELYERQYLSYKTQLEQPQTSNKHH